MVAGRFARHDPTDRGPILLSCRGSLQAAPLWDPEAESTPSLFELLAELDGERHEEVLGAALF